MSSEDLKQEMNKKSLEEKIEYYKNIGKGKVDSRLAGAAYRDSDFKRHLDINFDSTKNTCHVYTLNGEYTVSGNTITIDCKKECALWTSTTFEEYLKAWEIQAPKNKKDNWDSLSEKEKEEIKKEFKQQQKGYNAYLNEPPLVGVISDDNKTITFKKFAIPGMDKIERYENVVLTREER